jgi:hypothetical protein
LEQEMSELEPCPFCGEYPKFYGATDGSGFEAIDCVNDDCQVSPTTDYMNYEDALKAWNTRAAPKVKALEWFRYTTSCYGHGILGQGYRIDVKAACCELYLDRDDQAREFLGEYKIQDQAKAAAQSHYEKLVLEALE